MRRVKKARRTMQMQTMARPRRPARRRISAPANPLRRLARLPARLPPALRRAAAAACALVLLAAALGAAADAASEPLRAELHDAAWLRVRGIAVRGTCTLNPEQVRAALPGVTGTHIFVANCDSLAERVEGIERVLSARVTRNLLLRRIDVCVEERTAVALALDAAGRPQEIDATGVFLPIDPDRVERDLVFLVGTAEGGVAGIEAGLAVIQALRVRGLEVLLSELDVSDPAFPVGVEVATGTRVEFSDSYPAARQAEHQAVVLQTIGEQNLIPERIDLRFPGLVEVIPKNQADGPPPARQERG